ncbi:hypothetical protein LCGC14_0124270 [marine sediment metagenome]|uniref:Glycosyl hydrolase family 32 N-terminal domain-containing protein n=1 Tax=marine sediment metagenome TaxID=412755 RepID=A0A0F9VL92_9ZZZZ|nr:hypothetical protein [Phycisphaerae bacterium]HDZ42327.1 hypothetical protein [Phycisphaerae bacterium]
MRGPIRPAKREILPFEVFASFKRIEKGNPIIACGPPQWAAATHGIVVGDTLHYIWARNQNNRWVLMHSTAPVSRPWEVEHDPRNPILQPSADGFDDKSVEYPFPFRNPADGTFYMYYRGEGHNAPEQTGLLVSDGDLGKWRRVGTTPVILADTDHERWGATHPSVAVVGDTIHIVYTGRPTGSCEEGVTICHATAPTSDPANVTKNPANPVFTGTGQPWDSFGVREAELFVGPEYIHMLYGGCDGKTCRIGHVRTRDFRAFEPSPLNPVFVPDEDPDAWDCDGVLTPQVIKVGDTYTMIYAGRKGNEWQTGLAIARPSAE